MTDRMDLKAYLSRREEHDHGDSFRDVCLRCCRPKTSCFCDDIQSFDTETYIVILMHPKEAKKVKLGTGRLTHLFMNNSEIRIGLEFEDDGRVNSLINDPRYFPVILYPGEDSIDISRNDFLINHITNKILLVFVIDASWPLAKKMLGKSQNLQTLSQIHFRPQEASQYKLKKQPHPYCLCTIEAVSLLLEELENMGLENCQGNHRVLREALEKMCQLQSEFARHAKGSESRGKKGLKSKPSRKPGKRQRRSVRFGERDE